MSASGGVRREPTSSPVVKGVTIDRLDSAIEQLMKMVIVKRDDGKILSPAEVSGLLWTRLLSKS